MRYQDAVKILRDNNITAPENEVSIILCSLLKIDRAKLPLLMGEDIKVEGLREILSRRSEGYPLQYILGEWDFFGLTFEVNESCLCPRPDTELLVEKAIEELPENAEFLELCTGSGCIPVAVCKHRRDVKGRATELCREALELAEKNAARNGVSDRIDFIKADVFNIAEANISDGKKYDAILSNPPYIPTDTVKKLKGEVTFEPTVALDGGRDGMDFYRIIVGEYSEYLKDDGKIMLEIGYDQAKAIADIAESAGFDCKIFKDLGGNDRVSILKRKNKLRT